MIHSFFDSVTHTVTHVVHDGRDCAIIDPVLDYDPKSGRTSTHSAQQVLNFVVQRGLQVQWILETHAHADHLSAAAWIKQHYGGRTGIGRQITQVQKVFQPIFNLEPEFTCDGSQFDHLFDDKETFSIGSLHAQAWHVPGHTPADMAYIVQTRDEMAVFVGDTLFMPDVGTARCDFPGGDAATLYRSIQRLLALPAATRLYMCHDYPPTTRRVQWVCSVAEQKAHNIHVHDGISATAFVEMRNARDRTLEMPVLILPAIQVNIRAGDLSAPEANGVRYLKIPLNRL
ncbi:MAG: MBL fold metallo-hydrolase [Burkholderiales bacterium]|jgi:glyoxylase-like metal-dependent hydrolase (beta-lactamase superfamily II)